MEKYILSLDQGTTSSRAIVFGTNGMPIGSSQHSFKQIYPCPGWVEHDPLDILESLYSSVTDVINKTDVPITAIGITNQRETVVVWEKSSGNPVYNAVVWQCRRTAPECEKLIRHGYSEYIRETTGLNIDAYYSATKIKWILENTPFGVQRAKNGELLCGTIDSWLIWNLTGGAVHATDTSNASRTMLFNIKNHCWDEKICNLLNIPTCMLPKVKNSTDDFGVIADISGLPASLCGVPIKSAVGDQQAALFGQACFHPGDVKNTYGTGCFTLMNTGKEPVINGGGLVATIAWSINGSTMYALEGSVFNAGSSIQWLRDELGIINNAHECDILAESVPDCGGVSFVSAFTGLGAPYWDMYARGTMLGITRGTTKAHICRAVLEGIALQVNDLVREMEKVSGVHLNMLRVDGGASVSDFLLQTQSDILGIAVERPIVTETTALGAALLAGIGAGIWKNMAEVALTRKSDALFAPEIDETERAKRLKIWYESIKRSRSWAML